jgi:predicted Zn-dependent protease
VGLREKDLFELREQVLANSTQVKLGAALLALAIAAAGAFGLSKLRDLNQLIDSKLTSKMDESLGYYEQVAKAIYLANNNSCNSAIPILRELLDRRPTDEIVFFNLLNCLSEQERLGEALPIIQALKDKGLFPAKLTRSMSFNNAGLCYLWHSKDFRDEPDSQ